MVRFASLLSQLLSLFPRTEFAQAVRQHRAERYMKRFSCWDQFVAMLFCQMAQAKSLREICGGLACCLGKLQHLGVTTAPSKSTLAYANEHRPWQLYETVFGQLLKKCQVLAQGRKTFRFRNKLYSMDSTVVDLCVSLFDWAKFRQTKGAIKLHLLLDHEGYLPTLGLITDGKVHDVKVAQQMSFPAGSFAVVDRGYVDYALFGRWCREGVWFVTRMKDNASYRVVKRLRVPRNRGVLSDRIIELTGPGTWAKCPFRLRRIAVYDDESGLTLVFLTNHMGFGATTIARIYKDRWQIELFFKALNMLVLKYLQFRSRLSWALSNLVALLRWNLFTYRDLWAWLDEPFETPPQAPYAEQLCLGLG